MTASVASDIDLKRWTNKERKYSQAHSAIGIDEMWLWVTCDIFRWHLHTHTSSIQTHQIRAHFLLAFALFRYVIWCGVLKFQKVTICCDMNSNVSRNFSIGAVLGCQMKHFSFSDWSNNRFYSNAARLVLQNSLNGQLGSCIKSPNRGKK